MTLTINELTVYYQRRKGDKPPVLILHGWGCDVTSTRRIFNFLADLGHDAVAIDLPGFGRSDTPVSPLTVYDYANIVRAVIATLFTTPVIVLGHSFGGRIAMIIANDVSVERIILVGAAGLKPRRKLSYYVKLYRYKIAKKRGKITARYGSADYKSARGVMREIMVAAVNTDLTAVSKNIKKTAFLIWGERDDQTPLYMARKLHRNIKGSKLTVIKNAGHFCFNDNFLQFCHALEEALC